VLYCFTAIASILLGCFNVTNIYRHDVWLLEGVPWRASYLWGELVRYGILLIAPAAALLLAGIGILSASASRTRVFLLTAVVVLPFITFTCFPHPHGARAMLYVAGPITSVLTSAAYSRASYEKCAFWSSAALLLAEIFIIYWEFDSVITPIRGSYLLWGAVEFAILGLVSLTCLLSAIRFVHIFRATRLARKLSPPNPLC
jgi:hypothetical protein